MALTILIIMIVFGILGCIIELSKIGDQRNLNYKVLEQKAKFQNVV